jgi:hypothetical protein
LIFKKIHHTGLIFKKIHHTGLIFLLKIFCYFRNNKITMKIGIIGFAKRGLDLDSKSYEIMVQKMTHIVGRYPSDVIVYSGGSIWSDHVAITLFLQGTIRNLVLHLPDTWNSQQQCFSETTHSGILLNKKHQLFSKNIGRNTLQDIDLALSKGANYTSSLSSSKRNTLIAQDAEHLYAFVIKGEKMTPGTKDTWTKSHGKKIKINV